MTVARPTVRLHGGAGPAEDGDGVRSEGAQRRNAGLARGLHEVWIAKRIEERQGCLWPVATARENRKVQPHGVVGAHGTRQR